MNTFMSKLLCEYVCYLLSSILVLTLDKNSTIHQVTTMLATSENVIFPGHTHHANHRYWWPCTLIITLAGAHNHTIIRAAFVRLLVPLLLRGPLADLRQTWWVCVGGPRNCPWGVLFWKAQRVNGSMGQTSLFWSRRHQAETTPLQNGCPAKGTRHLRV